jgi:hypothetical protein
VDWVPFLREFGLPLAFLAVIGYTGWKEVWVWGSTHRDVKGQRDKLQQQVDRLLELAYKNAELAKAANEEKTDAIDKAVRIQAQEQKKGGN